MKWYQFIATECDGPGGTWRLMAGIDEEQLSDTLWNLLDRQTKPSELETYFLAVSILHRKARQLLNVRKNGIGRIHFSTLETLKPVPKLETPDFAKGGISLWIAS